MNPNPNPNNPNPNAVAGAGEAAHESKDPRFFWLTVAQFALIIGVSIALVYAIINGVKDVKELADLDTARGLITFVITLGTVTIAIMLTLTAVLVRDFDKRISVGKEVLTVLVGVLGTIVGFYYGAATKKDTGITTQASQVSVAPVKTPEEVKSGDKVTISTKLTGGVAPYSYSIKFTPDTIQEIKGESAKGDISHEITAAVPAGTDIVFVIEGTDKSGAAFVYNKDGKQKIHVR
jgi:heme/copper-type cytochrome/quinol oxidase subunit 2